MRRWIAVMLWIALAGAGATRAQTPTPQVLDLSVLPPMGARGHDAYAQRFLVSNLPRAFAVAANGSWGFASAARSPEDARAKALAACTKANGTGCEIYAQDLDVVWHGVAPGTHAVPGPLISAEHDVFVPDPRFFWHGPKAARGVVVWSHGKGKTDERGQQPHPYVRWFNNAGFDVVRFDREMLWDDKMRASGWLHDGLARLRAAGYASVIAAGQSRGSWNALQTLDTPGLADVVIAVAPAAQGTDQTNVALRQGPELWRILHEANPGRTRVAFVQFHDDPFSDDPDRRMATFREQLVPKAAAFLAIDRPAGLSGHGAAGSALFSARYGACLLHFALDARPPSAC